MLAHTQGNVSLTETTLKGGEVHVAMASECNVGLVLIHRCIGRRPTGRRGGRNNANVPTFRDLWIIPRRFADLGTLAHLRVPTLHA